MNKKMLVKFVDLLKGPIDLFLALLLIPSGIICKLFRLIGAGRLPVSRMILRKIGVFPIRDHYYEPLFNPAHLTAKLNEDRVLPGIFLNESTQLNLLSRMNFSSELIEMDLASKSSKVEDFYIENGSFNSGDAEFLYQFIRQKKPNIVVEIGSGNSTKIAKLALDKNYLDTGIKSTHICVEPYEMPWLESIGVEVIRQRVEACPMHIFKDLNAGDLLFIDSSHVIRAQGDVLHEYLVILPSLKPGVYVHVHDIFTPKDYLTKWIVDDVRLWNEQYLLEAMLGHSSRYEVVAALNYLKHHHYSALASVCPYLTEDREPGSFYFRVRD